MRPFESVLRHMGVAALHQPGGDVVPSRAQIMNARRQAEAAKFVERLQRRKRAALESCQHEIGLAHRLAFMRSSSALTWGGISPLVNGSAVEATGTWPLLA